MYSVWMICPVKKNVSKPIYISHNPQQDLFDKNKEELKNFTCNLLLNNNEVYGTLLRYCGTIHGKNDVVEILKHYCARFLLQTQIKAERSELIKLLFLYEIDFNKKVRQAVDELLYNTFIEVLSESEKALSKFVVDRLRTEDGRYPIADVKSLRKNCYELIVVLRDICMHAPEISIKPCVKALLLSKNNTIEAEVHITILEAFFKYLHTKSYNILLSKLMFV